MSGVTGSAVSLGYTIKDVAKDLMGFTEKGPLGDKHQVLDKGDLIGEGLAGLGGATEMATSIKSLAQGCFHEDGLNLIKTAGKHMTDPTWLRQNFANHGVDVARAMADGVLGMADGDYGRFGNDIGKSFRKVLVSTNPGEAASLLPAGTNVQLLTEQVADGVMNGVFGKGTGLQITDKKDPRVNMNIDLNKCFYGNRNTWENMFEGTWDVISKFAVGAGNPTAPGAVNNLGATNTADWKSELMSSMMGLPSAMEHCGLGFGEFGDIKRSFKNMQGLHFKFKLPDSKNINDICKHYSKAGADVQEKMAKSIQDFAKQDYSSFGGHLGKFIRDGGIMAARKFGGEDKCDKFASKFDITFEIVEPESWEMQEDLSSLSVTAMYGGVAAAFLVILVAVRIVRPRAARAGSDDDDEEKQAQLTSELQEDMESSAVE